MKGTQFPLGSYIEFVRGTCCLCTEIVPELQRKRGVMYRAPGQGLFHVMAKPHNTDMLRPREDLAKGHRAEGPPGSLSLEIPFSLNPHP